jgi:signal transduction histidine kinase
MKRDIKPYYTAKYNHNVFFVIISVLLFFIGFISFVLLKNATKLEHLENTRHNLYSLGTELKESSEDLTKYCRTYVMTGDSVWEKKYWEVLDIRNGIRLRPDGNKIALIDSLLKLGIVEDEFKKLSLAEKKSNRLVWTEKVAFNAMKGLFANKSNEFTVKARPDTLFAREILFSKKYHDDKESIMRPISEFRSMLNTRTAIEIQKQKNVNNSLLVITLILILIISLLSFYAIIVLRRKIVTQISELSETNIIIKENEENLIQQNEEISALLDNLKETNNELQELNATKDKFFSIIAHDLRNPFNLILNFSELLAKKVDNYSPIQIKEFAQITYDSAKNTYKLLENLLSWARIQTGSINSVPENICPSELLIEIINIYEPIANNKKVKLETVIHSDNSIFADKEMVNAILRNLITNAIKFSYPDKTVKIEIKKQDKNLLFTISDTGIGIGPEYVEKIFNIDSKLSKTGTVGESGTGLGLVLCKEFVEKNNGKIWVESKVGEGSSFKFTLPLSVV